MKKLVVLLLLNSWITFGQTTDDYDFELNLKINIEDTGTCYAHTTFIKSDRVKVSYYFIHTSINEATLIEANDGVIKISGNYTTLIGVRQIQPILVIMVEPIYGKKQDCNKKINSYFIDFSAIAFDRIKAPFVLGLQTLNLGDQKHIRLLGDRTQPKIEYSAFIFPETFRALQFDLPYWYRIE